MTLLSPELVKRLANFKIIMNKNVRGGHKGERRSQRLGSSLEFSDYRLYSPGDDLRQIDWNTYARSHKYYIKRFLDEQELAVTVYLDCTKSMGISEQKWQRAKQIAAIFSYLSLANSDRLGIYPISSDTNRLPYTRGKPMANRSIQFIEDISLASVGVCFGQHLQSVSSTTKPSGLHIVISDFLEDPENLFQSIKKMQAKHQQVLLVHVVLPDEQNPEYVGDLRLVDVETNEIREVSMNRNIIDHYKQMYQDHFVKIKSFCTSRAIDFIECPISLSLEKFIFSILMERGWVGR